MKQVSECRGIMSQSCWVRLCCVNINLRVNMQCVHKLKPLEMFDFTLKRIWFISHISTPLKRLLNLEAITCRITQVQHLHKIQSIYLFSDCLSRFGSVGEQFKQRIPNFPHPAHFFQLIWGHTKLFKSQPRDMISPANSGAVFGPSSGRTYLKDLV